jgi:hypothetical protein
MDGVRTCRQAAAAVVRGQVAKARPHPYNVQINDLPMRHSCRLRFLTVLVALFSLLFMQLAMAAYACPDLIQQESPMLNAVGQPMADCPQVDRKSPTLCHAQTHKFAQSLDKPDAPLVPPFIPTGFWLQIVWAVDTAFVRDAPVETVHPAGASPPIAIRHCCFGL